MGGVLFAFPIVATRSPDADEFLELFAPGEVAMVPR
jgi:hypothetical protein